VTFEVELCKIRHKESFFFGVPEDAHRGRCEVFGKIPWPLSATTLPTAGEIFKDCETRGFRWAHRPGVPCLHKERRHHMGGGRLELEQTAEKLVEESE